MTAYLWGFAAWLGGLLMGMGVGSVRDLSGIEAIGWGLAIIALVALSKH